MAKIAFVIALVFVPAVVAAQTDPELIAEATLALPDQLKDGATAAVTDDDGNRRVLREGTNAFVCSPDGPAAPHPLLEG